MTKAEAHAKIRNNIERHGVHVYTVSGSAAPRFSYTIGLSPRIGAELVLGGAAFYSSSETKRIIDTLAQQPDSLRDGSCFRNEYGAFSLRSAHESWTNEVIRGALDYYNNRLISALQVIPDDEHWTSDVPDMRLSLNSDSTWRFLCDPWPYNVSTRSVALTSLSILQGERVTEMLRQGEREWHFFGCATSPDDERPYATQLAAVIGSDPSLTVATEIQVGARLQRDTDSEEWRAAD